MKYRTLICHCVLNSYLRYLYKFCEETHCSFIFLFRLLSFGQDSGAFFEILEYSKTEAREALAGWWRRHVTLSVVLIGFQNNERDLFMLWGELRVTANCFWSQLSIFGLFYLPSNKSRTSPFRQRFNVKSCLDLEQNGKRRRNSGSFPDVSADSFANRISA